MDVTLFAEKFSAFDKEPQKYLQKRPSELPGESKLTSLCSVEHLHYNWLVRRALYKWRKSERDRCLQDKLRMTYRPDAERKMSNIVSGTYPWPNVSHFERKMSDSAHKIYSQQNIKVDLSSSVQVVPIRRHEESKSKKNFSVQRKPILKVNSLQQGVKYRIRRVRSIWRRRGTTLVADLHDGNTIFLPASFISLSKEEVEFLDSGNVYVTYHGRIGDMDILNFE